MEGILGAHRLKISTLYHVGNRMGHEGGDFGWREPYIFKKSKERYTIRIYAKEKVRNRHGK
ncbi:MAG: hypothetical protein JSW00_00830 [Thermoplasmata archaeon]|nr:MAG: hypothetical protein JSW00_00830 [Thermoplasmata archaeon]